MKTRLIVLAMFLPLLPLSAEAVRAGQATIAPGIYSSVTMSPDSGDLGGLEIEIGRAGQVETVLCEGWCNSTDRATYRRRGGSIVYDLREETIGPGGRITVTARPVELRPSGRNVLAKMDGDTRWWMLKRKPRPFGLSVAHDAMRETAARRR
jgi:hypothetical protein